MSILKSITYLFVTLLVCVLFIPAHGDEESAIKILAPWKAEGKVYRVGPEQTEFVGAFEGIMYVETGEGELNTAIFVCPTTHELNEATQKTRASGRCHIAAAGGNVFGQFSCEGNLKTCIGRFEITAGTDEFEGMTGSGEIQIKTALSSTMRDAVSGAVVAEAEGLAVWPNLTINIPRQ